MRYGEGNASQKNSSAYNFTQEFCMLIDSVFYVHCALCGVALYLLFTQWAYCYRISRRWRNSQEKNVTFLMAVISTTIPITMATETVRIYISRSPVSVNEILYYGSTMLYAISLILMYTVLWLRQRTLYSCPALFELTNKFARIVSKYVIVGLITVGVFLTLAICITDSLGYCVGECFENLYYVALLAAPCFAQLVLLILFLFPLLKHHQTTNLVTEHRYVCLMRRVAILTATCFISDVASAIIEFHALEFVALQANLIVNFLCIILATTNWKSRLLPCIKSYRDTPEGMRYERSPVGACQTCNSVDCTPGGEKNEPGDEAKKRRHVLSKDCHVISV